jgi:hypothetical protein
MLANTGPILQVGEARYRIGVAAVGGVGQKWASISSARLLAWSLFSPLKR